MTTTVPVNSKYRIEDYFEGFVVGISKLPNNTDAHVCKNEKPKVKQIAIEWDSLETLLRNRHYSLWEWDVEYYKIFLFLCTAFTQSVAVNDICDLDYYFWMVREKYVTSWHEWYAHVVHWMWSIFLYFFYGLYGIVWSDYYDIGYAIGMQVRILADHTLEEATAKKTHCLALAALVPP